MRLTIVLLLSCTFCLAARSEEAFPNQFSKLLKEGQWVSYSIVENQYLISIASDEAREMHLKGRLAEPEELIKLNPFVADAVQQALKQRDPPRKGYRYSSDTPRLSWADQFRKILFLGKDYVVLSKTDSDEPYSAIPTRRVSLIKWLDITPRISFSRIQERIPESKPDEQAKTNTTEESQNENSSEGIEEKMLKYAKRIVERYDKDDDKAMSKSEWEKMLMSPSAADANRNGKITVEEYARWMQNRSRR